VPWNYDDEACDVLRRFTKLKCRLMPYLWAQAVAAHQTGVPVMRAMLLEFPDDPASDTLERQYLLGDALLVAPVFSADGRTDFYLPAGRWTHLLTGEVREGGRWHRGTYGFLEMPLFVRPGRILALGTGEDAFDYAYAEGVTFQVYELADGAEATAAVHDLKGRVAATVTVRRRGRSLEAELAGAAKGWRVQFCGVAAVDAVEGGQVQADPLGVVVARWGAAPILRARLPA
jgi:alpha-D-xyloside xylohydrolase